MSHSRHHPVGRTTEKKKLVKKKIKLKERNKQQNL